MATGSEMYYGTYQFVPVPIIGWTTDTIYDNKLDRLFLRHTLDLAGAILSPAAESGRLDYLLSQRQLLQNALASGQQELKLYFNGALQVSGVYPRPSTVNFTDEVWVDKINYTTSLEWDEDYYSNHIQSWSETWDFEEDENRQTCNVSHSISAVGLNTMPSGINNTFTNAKSFVLGKTGWANVISGSPAFAQASGSYNAYERHARQESADVQAGSFGITEVFTLSSGTYNHEYSEQYSVDDTGIVTVALDGTITGHGRGPNAYNRAIAGWNVIKLQIPSMASGAYSALGGDSTLYTTNYDSFSISRNTFTGVVSYSASYTDAAAENLPSGILEFAINVNDNKPTRVYASFGIPQRALGNVVQDIATSTEGTLTISGNATAKQSYDFEDLLDWVESKINAKRPSSGNYETLRLTQKQITKDEDNKTVQFNIVWTYTLDLSSVAVDGYVSLN